MCVVIIQEEDGCIVQTAWSRAAGLYGASRKQTAPSTTEQVDMYADKKTDKQTITSRQADRRWTDDVGSSRQVYIQERTTGRRVAIDHKK